MFRSIWLGPTLLAACVAGCSAGDRDPDRPQADGGRDDAASPEAADSGAGDAGVDGSPGPGHNAGGADAGLDLWVNPAGCNQGGIGARFQGVPAYCQPPGTTSADGYYQCDELANRFMRDALEHPNLDNAVTEFASSICGEASSMPAYSAWGPGYRATSGRKPEPGDLVVFSGTPGHVAVIVDASTPDSVRIMQQNESPPVADIGWDPSTSFFTAPSAECWVHAEPAPAAPAPTGAACGCFDGDGDYCGLSLVDHAWWYGCEANVAGGPPEYDTLYTCSGGTFTPKQACAGQCLTMFEQPATGACMPDASNDPCSGVPSSADGIYCGASTQNGFGGGESSTLYDCRNGTTVSVRSCANGCYSAPAGQQDGCR